MAVLVIAQVPEDRQQVEVWRERNKALPQQPGFLFQGDGPRDGGRMVVSAWESRQDFERYFESQVRPNIPPGMEARPPEIHELEAAVTR